MKITKRNLIKLIKEQLTTDIEDRFKKGWINTFVKRKNDNKRFKVIDARHYGSETELDLENGVTLTDRYGPYLQDDKKNKYITD